ncbi:MAG: hypothetical protein AAGF48_12985 [Pseudomonadota bacterium]
MLNTTPVPQNLASEKFWDAMQLFVGRGRRWSCPAVAAATQIPLRTIEAYRARQCGPSLENYHTLCSVLGQAFFAATIEYMPFAVRTLEPGDETPQQVLTHAIAFSGELSRMLEDGTITYSEERDVLLACGKLRERIAALEAHFNQRSTS